MVASFDFNDSGRLGREKNLYTGCVQVFLSPLLNFDLRTPAVSGCAKVKIKERGGCLSLPPLPPTASFIFKLNMAS